MKSKVFFLFISLLFILLFPLQSKVKSETILEEINRTGLLKVGIREDAVPFGYRDLNNNLTGLCLDFINVFHQQLKKQLNKEIILIKIYKSTLFNRFDLVSDRIIYLECGPNTIRDIPDYNVQFSNPFFITGTQLLIKANNEEKVDLESNLQDIKIGILVNTSNQQLLSTRYPLANFVEFQGVTGRYRGVQALQGDKIDGFASDGILLIGEATLQGLNLGKDYIVVPQFPLDCAKYGLIIPKNDPEWLNFVNSVIQIPQTKTTFGKWFDVILPEIESITEFCQKTG
ncbi:extracellular solute-binding protein family 3 [Rippkaea orientalis PCC 8801]|uniref:Extracellular solute-binding protein family 3 n=1 Tax=Rippkaea orientalis (strain PCC 8801 / RF-1) TaxID=41431 RepID=B7K516_RIPO1|nr:amino acid ABC transporter substrate-binding protein [Rippkaea orientalis]ACK66672.1 extracellular solute-binding protein family 3 [Rippkaea orientalis PCC 8801]